MALVPLDIDPDLEPMVEQLIEIAISRYEAGENPAKLKISPENNKYTGRLSLLMGEKLAVGYEGYIASTSCWGGVSHSGVIAVTFDGDRSRRF